MKKILLSAVATVCLAGAAPLAGYAQDDAPPPPPPPPAAEREQAVEPDQDRPRDRAPDREGRRRDAHRRGPGDDQRFSPAQWTRMEQRLNEAWTRMPVAEKMQVMQFHRAFKSMGHEEREFIRDRIERFMEMSEDDRQQLRTNRERWKKMSPEERERTRGEFKRRREDFERRWREEHPGEDPPPFRPRRRGPPRHDQSQSNPTKGDIKP